MDKCVELKCTKFESRYEQHGCEGTFMWSVPHIGLHSHHCSVCMCLIILSFQLTELHSVFVLNVLIYILDVIFKD